MKKRGCVTISRVAFFALLGMCLLASGVAIGSQAFPRTVVEEMEVEKPVMVTEIVEKTVIKEYPVYVTKEVEVSRSLRHFKSTDEFRDLMGRYTEGMTVLGGNCVDISLFLVGIAREDGYYVDTEILEGSNHMVIKGFCDDGDCQSVEFYDLDANRFWRRVVPANTYDLSAMD